MNHTNSTELVPRLTFTVSDGIFVSLQMIIYLLLIILLFLFIIFRKEKALKFRGVLPFFSVAGVWIITIRFIFSNLSIFKIGNKESLTAKFVFYQ
jgi:hypothetical protein